MSTSNTEDLEQYDLYRIIKLTTGEMLFCVLVDEGDKTTTFEHPVQVEFVKVIRQNGIEHELSYTPYCPFSNDRTFVLPTSSIQHMNGMSESMVKSYLNMIYGKETMDQTVPENTVIH